MKSLIKRILLKLYTYSKKLYWDDRYNKMREKYKIDVSFRFNGEGILFYGDGEIICGSNSYIGSLSTILAKKGQKVFIGKNCTLSHNLRAYTSSSNVDQDWNLEERTEKRGDIIINDGVWIGANVFINPGITLGKNAVIGANSVVTKDVPENAIYGGVPAKLIRFKKI